MRDTTAPVFGSVTADANTVTFDGSNRTNTGRPDTSSISRTQYEFPKMSPSYDTVVNRAPVEPPAHGSSNRARSRVPYSRPGRFDAKSIACHWNRNSEIVDARFCINAAIGAGYYLRIVSVMYFRPLVATPKAEGGNGARWAATLGVAAVLVVGLLLGPYLMGATNQYALQALELDRSTPAVPLPVADQSDARGQVAER